MIIISSRKNFDDPDNFSHQDEVFNLTLGSGGSVLDKTKMQSSEVTQAVSNKSILIVIHGYNNDLCDALRAYSIIEYKVKNLLEGGKYDAVVGYVWPGGDKKLEYHLARSRSSAAGERFVSWLPTFSGVDSLDIMTHSMGTRVLLRGLSSGVPSSSASIRNHLATASAVDNESIEYGERFYEATKRSEATWVFHSKKDSVLRYAYTVGDCDFALGLTGPEDPAKISRHSKNVKVVNCKKYVGSHGSYKNCDKFYRFTDKIINDRHPSSRQFYTL